ncbi:MAG: DUF2520 domain-containing protein [Gammaproteobacteria bacterium]|nr:DUF2520 domain-containing protein [Gammaproteobacteria bacterium]
MQQVPLIIGNGRLARHLQYYFSLLHLPFVSWHRDQPLMLLYEKVDCVSTILILINDDAIEPFAKQYLSTTKAKLIHCSGSFFSNKIFGAHPLMTFGKDLYSEATYRSIPFIVDENAPSWEELFPDLPNMHFRLNPANKAKYHALCVLSGNFSCLLWQKLFHALEKELHLPAKIAYPFFWRQMQNLLDNPSTALTGPVSRQDVTTINKNLAALVGDPFYQVYQSFINCYQKLEGNL